MKKKKKGWKGHKNKIPEFNIITSGYRQAIALTRETGVTQVAHSTQSWG